ncbi:spore germination protein [Paenibacillus paeoniae]|uniref:Spore germination protein n=1 Tax=Paenibacillus paeoniae TaxID=2292705 RepID=A0A371PMA9_9BACL|nr:spore germination protein [Paenibacillus paeoniae]REK76789.1 spore germination protein [Paenibacillus paeoniae]
MNQQQTDTSKRLNLVNLNRFREEISHAFGRPPDLIFRKVKELLIVYIAGLVDQARVEKEIIVALESADAGGSYTDMDSPHVQKTDDFDLALQLLLSGMVLIAEPNQSYVIAADAASMPHRSITTSETENVIHGPREGFTELLVTNVALLRRILSSPKLRVHDSCKGTYSGTKIALLYLEGLAPAALISNMQKRLESVQLDGVIDSNYISEQIRDRPRSLFPTLQSTERPDVVADALLKGRVVVLVNNSPFALVAPFLFWNAFQSIEDHFLLYSSANFLRIIRAIFIIMALFLPSLYVAITTFHIEMLPMELMLSIAASRERTPFPAIVEALIMESIFEALREAVVRMPQRLSQTASVLGALVIGQAIVQAGIVSIPMIIVVSITGIASLMIPRYEMTFAVRILRMLLLFMAATLGFYGIAVGIFFTQVYLTGLRSFGVPYLSPIAPLVWKHFQHFFIRKPTAQSEVTTDHKRKKDWS